MDTAHVHDTYYSARHPAQKAKLSMATIMDDGWSGWFGLSWAFLVLQESLALLVSFAFSWSWCWLVDKVSYIRILYVLYILEYALVSQNLSDGITKKESYY